MSALILVLALQEFRIDDVDFDRALAPAVQSAEALEKTWRKDPKGSMPAAEALVAATERDVAPRFPGAVEALLLIRTTRGIDKGQIVQRRFFPYRLAGEVALEAGEPARAAAWLERSPTSKELLARAKAAKPADPVRPPPPPAPLLKPLPDPAPLVAQGDFAGALQLLASRKEDFGEAYAAKAAEIRKAAESRQREATSRLASVLPRLREPGFRSDHVAPCLAACAKVPADAELEELRWTRRLDAWLAAGAKTPLDALALEAARFAEADFKAAAELAARERLAEAAGLVEAARQAGKAERAPILDRLGACERALRTLLAARPDEAAAAALAGHLARLPVDLEALDRARRGVEGVDDLRRLAGELERIWTGEARTKLSVPDQKDLALHLALFRAGALFLDGLTVAEVARDARVAEAFRAAGPLPEGTSPKMAAVRARIQ